LEIAAADNGGEIKIAVRRIVDGVAKDSAFLGREEDFMIHGAATSGGNGEKNLAEIFGAKFALMPDDISRRGKVGYFRFGLRSDDGYVRTGTKQGSDFRSGDRTSADDQARAIFEFDECRK
jgi:hypothetical protein